MDSSPADAVAKKMANAFICVDRGGGGGGEAWAT